MSEGVDEVARLIAMLLAQRAVARTHPLALRAQIDLDFRGELERRLAAAGLRLLANPFADHLAVALTFETEQAVFGQGTAWLNNNFGLPRDGVALLVLLWALIILPKRERQWSRQPDEQGDMFGAAKPLPVAADAARGIAEATLLSDYAQAVGGKMRIHVNLGILARLGFIERRNKVIHEGPLLDLAFDYEQIAPRIINGALADLLAGKSTAGTPAPDEATAPPANPANRSDGGQAAVANTLSPSTDALVKAAADALNFDD